MGKGKKGGGGKGKHQRRGGGNSRKQKDDSPVVARKKVAGKAFPVPVGPCVHTRPRGPVDLFHLPPLNVVRD